MATVTGNLFMLSLQRKLRYVMIEIKFIPVFGIMAFLTLLAEIAFVRVLFAVTVEAAGWSLRELLIRLMASCTGHVLMAALKMEIRIIVVEGCVIQNGDICIPANMVGMAYLAGGLCDCRLQAMKALTSHEISVDYFVAVSTKLGLCILFEACMTAGTLAFVFSVSLDNFARHQQSFDISSACDVHKEKAHRGKYY
jgi:hypothetical protein